MRHSTSLLPINSKDNDVDCSEYYCPVCNAEAGKVLLTRLRDRHYEIPGEWELVECVKCSNVYAVPPLRSR